MSSLVSICVIYFHIAITVSTSKIFQLTPNTVSSANDISITLGPGASVTSNIWSIDVNSQRGTDLTVHLGPSWGFHPSHASTIELLLNGNTSTDTYDTDGEILFLFNVDHQYFAEMISIDSKRLAYKECPASDTPLIATNMSNIFHSDTPDRYHRFCNNTPDTSSTDHWALSTTSNGIGYKETAKWPMFMRITNDPISNIISYAWGDISSQGAILVSSQYTSSFTTDQGVDIHISGEDHGEDFNIFSIDILYHFVGTEAPTETPTHAQTEPPTSPRPTTALPTTGHPTTVAPTTAMPTTTMAPTAATTTIASTNPITTAPITTVTTRTTFFPTVTPTDVPRTSRATDTTESPSVKPSIPPTVSLPPLEVTVPPPSIAVTEYTTLDPTMDDTTGFVDEKDSFFDLLPEKTWYIVLIGIGVLFCCCGLFLYFGLRMIKTDERVISPKAYKGVRVIADDCKDKEDEMEVSIPKPEGDISYNRCHHGYTSSNSKLNEVYDQNRFRHSADFSNNLSSAVTGDELLMDEIHHHMETDGDVDQYPLPHSHTSDDDVLAMSNETDSMMRTVTSTHVKKNTFSSLPDIDEIRRTSENDAPGHNGVQYEYDGQYEYNVNKHHYHGRHPGHHPVPHHDQEAASSSEELLDAMNEDVYGNTNGQYAKYEIGMVTMSKISEMAPQSKGSHHRKEDKAKQRVNKESLAIEGDDFNDEYDGMSSDELLAMETAGFIDGDYNELEYEDEYYEDDD